MSKSVHPDIYVESAMSSESDDDDSASEDPQRNPDNYRRILFENILKKRIFYADRIEKVEKQLI